jgi:hypothetical protein
MFSNFFHKRAVYEIKSKNMAQPDVTTWRIRVCAGLVRLHARTRMHTPTHTHTHTPVCNICRFSTWTFANAPQCYLILHCLSGFS